MSSTGIAPPDREVLQDAEITGLSHDGRGVARVDGKVVFVDNALPGERVRFLPGRRQRSYATGTTIEIVRSSPDRLAPRCPYFGVCGGCALQHLAPAAQLRAKHQQLVDSLTRIGKVTPASYLQPLSGPQWGYRRKARLGVRHVPKKGGVLVGFRERHRSYVTPLATCDVLHPQIADRLPDLRELIASMSCYQRIPQIEVAVGDNATAMVLRHLVELTEADRDLLRAFAQRHESQVFVQPGGPNSIEPVWPTQPDELYYGLPRFDLTLAFAATDFIQVNGALNQRLVETAVSLLDPDPSETVLDLFCGLGNFTLPLARRAAAVTGVEGDHALVRRGQANALRNAVGNVDFEFADLDDADVDAGWLRRGYDKVLLDPPRSGAIEMIKRLPALRPSRVVYVSCNPATLARDAEVMVHRNGYKLSAAGIVDMFPHTAHVESIAVFDRA